MSGPLCSTFFVHGPGSLVSWRAPPSRVVSSSRRVSKGSTLAVAAAGGGHQETIPDGTSHTFPTGQHAEDFWLLWRHLMPLSGSPISFSAEAHQSLHLLGYPRIRLQRHWLKAKDVPESDFANGSIVKLAASMQDVLLKDGGKARTLAASEFGVNLRAIVRMEPSSGSRNDRKVYANPAVLWRSRVNWETERCEWLPGVNLKVPRPSALLVKASDENGRFTMALLRDEDARQFARAWDAMNGVLSLDLLHPEMVRRLREKLEKLEADASAEHNMSRRAEFRARGGEPLGAAHGPRMHRNSCFASYHEAGHTLLGILLPVARVEGVFVQRRGSVWSGGTEIVWPSVSMDADEIIIQAAAVWLGGLAAEELMFGRADLGVEAGSSFSDDLVNVAALGTAYVARRRNPALWSSDDQWEASICQLASAPPPTGWRNPSGSTDPAGAGAFEKGVAGQGERAELKSGSPQTVTGNRVLGTTRAAGGEAEGMKPEGGLSEVSGGREPSRVKRNLGLGPNDSTNAGFLCFVDEAYDMAMNLLVGNVDALHAIAGMLMDREGSISSGELEKVMARRRDPAKAT